MCSLSQNYNLMNLLNNILIILDCWCSADPEQWLVLHIWTVNEAFGPLFPMKALHGPVTRLCPRAKNTKGCLEAFSACDRPSSHALFPLQLPLPAPPWKLLLMEQSSAQSILLDTRFTSLALRGTGSLVLPREPAETTAPGRVSVHFVKVSCRKVAITHEIIHNKAAQC